MLWGVVPIKIEEISMRLPGNETDSLGYASAWTDESSARHFNTHTQLTTKSGETLMEVKNLCCVAYEAAVPQHALKVEKTKPFAEILWKPDIATLTSRQMYQSYPEIQSEPCLFGKLVELLNYIAPLTSVFLVGQRSVDYLNILSSLLPSNTSFTVGDTSAERLEGLKRKIAENDRVVTTLQLPTDRLHQWDRSMIKSLKLLLLDGDFMDSEIEARVLQLFKQLMAAEANLLCLVSNKAADTFALNFLSYGYTEPKLRFDFPDSTFMLSNPMNLTANGLIPVQKEATLLFFSHQSSI